MRTHYISPSQDWRSLCGHYIKQRSHNRKRPMLTTVKIEDVDCKVCLKRATEQLTEKLKATI